MKMWIKTMVLLCILMTGVFAGNMLDVQAGDLSDSPENAVYLEAERDVFFSTESFSISDTSVHEGAEYEWEIEYLSTLGSGDHLVLPTEYYTISEDGRTLTFDGVALENLLPEGGAFWIEVMKWMPDESVWGGSGARDSLHIYYQDPEYHYKEDEELRLRIIDDAYFYETMRFYVKDMYYPEGAYIESPCLSVEEVGNDILEFVEIDELGRVRMRPTGVGETSVVLSYNRYENDINGDKTDVLSQTYKLVITDVDYTIDYSWYVDGLPVEQVLSGETVQLETTVTAQKYDFDRSCVDIAIDPSMVVEAEDKNGEYWEMISQSAGEFSSGKTRYTKELTVKAGAADVLWNNLAGYTLRAYVEDEQVKAWDAWVKVKDSIYRIEIPEETKAVFEANLEKDQGVTFTPVLKKYTKTDAGIEEEVIENAVFSCNGLFMRAYMEEGNVILYRYREDKQAELTLTAQTEDGQEVSATWKFPALVEMVPEEIVEGFGTEEVYRVFGASRYETSYETANVLKEQLGVDQFDTAIIAYGKNFPDALAGSYLAGKTDAPILMINEKYADELTAYVKENVEEGSKIYVLGGEGAIPQEQLSGLGEYDLCRLAGKTRYETNLLILEEAGVTNQDILVCTGKNFADSLSASATGNPIFLVNNKELTDDQKAFLEAHKGNNYYIIGGTGAVSEEMEAQIAKYGETKRISGASRYETSVKLAEEFFDDAKVAVLASAKNYPDGLCGGPLAMSKNAPLILTATGKEAAAVKYLNDNDIKVGAVLGGESLISDEVVAKIFELESVDEIIKWK